MLPLPAEEIFQILTILTQDPDAEILHTALATLENFNVAQLLPIIQNPQTDPDVLGFVAVWPRSTHELAEAAILNQSTPDEAIARFAAVSNSSNLLEAITINQQRLIRHPAIIDAILSNPQRSPEAERRAREVKTEFFEKELGAARVADEQKARGARIAQALGVDISDDEFQQTLAQFEKDAGTPIENGDLPPMDPEAELLRFLKADEIEGETVDEGRRSIYKLLAIMSTKERIFMGLKGNREVRAILVRDANKMVSSAVLKNPRITDAEVENIAKLKGISEEVLRIICMNRAWVSNYTIMHYLTCNPRTPLTFTMNFINRLQTRDLKALGKNKGVPDVIRNMSNRLAAQRQQSGG
jgi:hypothetical protein